MKQIIKSFYKVLFLGGIVFLYACSISSNNKSIEETFIEQYPNAQLCSIKKINGLHSKEGLLSFIKSYDDTYEKAFDKIAIPSKIKKILKAEKERALDFVDRSSFKEYDLYVVYYLNNSQKDTLRLEVLCDINTQNVAVMYQPSKYENGEFVEDKVFTEWEENQKAYKETYAAVERYAEFATLVEMVMEEDDALLYAANMKQIQDFIIKYY